MSKPHSVTKGTCVCCMDVCFQVSFKRSDTVWSWTDKRKYVSHMVQGNFPPGYNEPTGSESSPVLLHHTHRPSLTVWLKSQNLIVFSFLSYDFTLYTFILHGLFSRYISCSWFIYFSYDQISRLETWSWWTADVQTQHWWERGSLTLDCRVSFIR